MPALRPFRFGTSIGPATSAAEYGDAACRIEALGYAVIDQGDHIASRFDPGVALTTAALATTTLRIACNVFANDFRHPAVLAKIAASIDVMSGGRFELGIGAGWQKREYDWIGLPFDSPGVRVSRLEEAVRVIKGLWAEGPVTFAGQHYTIIGLTGAPRPLQHPHPPIFMGGGGKRLLSFAAREADIVGILGQALPGGGLNIAGDSEAVMAEKIGWVREAAGTRFDQIELNLLVWGVAVTDDRRAAAERLAASGAGGLATAMAGAPWFTAEQLLASPYFLIGTVEQIVEQLLTQRERHGISYITVTAQNLETFAPVVARLAGK